MDPGLCLLQGNLQPECVREREEGRGEKRRERGRGEKGGGEKGGGRRKRERERGEERGKGGGGRGRREGEKGRKREERNAIKCRMQRTLIIKATWLDRQADRLIADVYLGSLRENGFRMAPIGFLLDRSTPLSMSFRVYTRPPMI